MKAVGIILAVIVTALVVYIVYAFFGGGVANAAAGEPQSNTLRRTSGANAKAPPPGTGPGTFTAWNPKSAGGISSGIVGAVEKLTGAKVLGFSDTKNM